MVCKAVCEYGVGPAFWTGIGYGVGAVLNPPAAISYSVCYGTWELTHRIALKIFPKAEYKHPITSHTFLLSWKALFLSASTPLLMLKILNCPTYLAMGSFLIVGFAVTVVAKAIFKKYRSHLEKHTKEIDRQAADLSPGAVAKQKQMNVALMIISAQYNSTVVNVAFTSKFAFKWVTSCCDQIGYIAKKFCSW